LPGVRGLGGAALAYLLTAVFGLAGLGLVLLVAADVVVALLLAREIGAGRPESRRAAPNRPQTGLVAGRDDGARSMIERLSAVTLATRDMGRAVRFYRLLGFEMLYGGETANFTSFRAGGSFLNLVAAPAGGKWSWWGRAIFYDSDIDGLHARLLAAGLRPQSAPRNAPWGERFFHVTDPDGHELSFAWPLAR
jgi:catechol 2,3-dioxygenase-like lactoylglutathione lyase family enzyme